MDRILLKFIVRFATFNRHDKSNFKISTSLRYLTKLIYHLRRSSFINTFGSPPDQSIYIKSCLLREDVTNCITMIQPILIKYTTEAEEGEEV